MPSTGHHWPVMQHARTHTLTAGKATDLPTLCLPSTCEMEVRVGFGQARGGLRVRKGGDSPDWGLGNSLQKRLGIMTGQELKGGVKAQPVSLQVTEAGAGLAFSCPTSHVKPGKAKANHVEDSSPSQHSLPLPYCVFFKRRKSPEKAVWQSITPKTYIPKRAPPRCAA